MIAYKKCIICNNDIGKMLYSPLRIVKCKNCGLIYRDAMDVEEKYYFDLDKYRQSLEDSAKMRARKRDAKFRFDIIEKIVKSKGTLLDIGANDGLFMLEAKNRGFKPLGCEPNIYAAQYAKGMGLEVINKPFEYAFNELRLKSPFKLVTLFHVLEHFPEPLKILNLIKEIISPDSWLVIEVPDIDSPVSKIYQWDGQRIAKEHLFYFDKKSLSLLLKKAGFKIVLAKRKTWDGLNRPFIENLIRCPFISEIYMLLRKIKNFLKILLKIGLKPKRNLDNNVDLWIKGKMREKKYLFARAFGRLILRLNRGDDLFVITKLYED